MDVGFEAGKTKRFNFNKGKVLTFAALFTFVGVGATFVGSAISMNRDDNAIIRTIKNDPGSLNTYLKLGYISPVMNSKGEQAEQIVCPKESGYDDSSIPTFKQELSKDTDGSVKTDLIEQGVKFDPIYKVIKNSGLLHSQPTFYVEPHK